MLLPATDPGLYCDAGDFWIGPWLPVPRAAITHAHGDHARWGCDAYLGALDGARVMRTRLGPEARIRSVPYGEVVELGGLRERLHCYWFGAAVGVLPPFGEFTGLADIAPISGERVYVVAGGEVIRVGA